MRLKTLFLLVLFLLVLPALAQDNDANTLIDEGIALFIAADYEAAVEKFDAALEIEKSGFAYNWRGFTQLLLGNVDESLADQIQAIELGEDFGYVDGALVYAVIEKHADAFNYYTIALDGMGGYAYPSSSAEDATNYEFIITVYSLVLEKYPQNYIALAMRGNSYANLGQLDKARADYDAALALQPDFWQVEDSLKIVVEIITERDRLLSGETCNVEAFDVLGFLQEGETISGEIDEAEDVWCFTVTTAPATITITMDKTSGNLNPMLILLTENGALLAQNNDVSRSDKDARLVQNFDITGTFFVVASRSGRAVGRTSGEYDLTLAVETGMD